MIFKLLLFVSLGVFIKIYKADDGIDLNVFQQHDYQLKFERLEMTRYNKNLLDVQIATFKYNRTIAVVNKTFTYKIDVGNDLVIIVQAYKFMSNEYRFFPMRFATNGCKAMGANVFGMATTRNCGNFTGCPIRKGITYHICNWYPDSSKFPPLIPNGQYKIELQMLYYSQEVAVEGVYVTITRPIPYV